MKIGELAKKANCTVETIRYYEKEGLMLAPERQENNYRDYTQAHLDRLRFIRNCRALDLNHEEIRELLKLTESEQSGCNSVNQVLDEHLEHVRTRILELQQLEKQLLKLYAFCRQHGDESEVEDVCGIIQGISELDYDAPTDLHTHDKRNYSHR